MKIEPIMDQMERKSRWNCFSPRNRFSPNVDHGVNRLTAVINSSNFDRVGSPLSTTPSGTCISHHLRFEHENAFRSLQYIRRPRNLQTYWNISYSYYNLYSDWKALRIARLNHFWKFWNIWKIFYFPAPWHRQKKIKFREFLSAVKIDYFVYNRSWA